MKSGLTLVVFVSLTATSWGGDRPVAPPPREKSALRCEVRWTGKSDGGADGFGKRITVYAFDRAEVTITNVSDADVDIGSKLGPHANLDLKVVDPNGMAVKTEQLPFLKVPSATLEHVPYLLKPGKSLRRDVSLLITVPKDQRVIGTYKVKAVYTVADKGYESGEVEVKWLGKK